MILSYLTLQKLLSELEADWSGARIRVGIQPPHDLILTGDNGKALCIGASTRRCYLYDRDEPAPRDLPAPPWASAHVDGASIRAIRQVPYERIVELDLLRLDRLGGRHKVILVLELIGRRSNVWLLNGDDRRVIAGLRSDRGNRSPGKPYTLPESRERHLPSDLTVDLLQRILSDDHEPATCLTRSISGLDPFLSLDLLAACGIESNDPGPEALQRLLDSIQRAVEEPNWAPKPAIIKVGRRHEICPIHLPHLDIEDRTEFGTVSETIAEVARSERSHVEAQGEARSIRKTLQRLLDAAERKVDNIRQDLEDAERAQELERFGNILMASLNDVPARAEAVTLPNLYREGEPIEIPLDPEKSAVENGEDYLKRSRKAKKAGPIAEKRRAKTEAERDQLKEAIGRLEQAEPGKLEDLKRDFVEKGWIRAGQARKQTQRRRAPGDINPRRYRTSDGWTVLVGKNNAENDKLTKGSARDDIFFHAQGCPGSHVILKREGKPGDPGKAALEEAAALAAFWSKARKSKTVPVNYTDVRHVSKPRGAAPGLVTIRNEKTVFVSPREIRKADE